MMIARPTAASAAATVMTKKTNTCPVTPYACANATNVRFTALSISSTHMKTMIALRRMSTPTTPITNSTAEKNSASANIAASRGFAALLAEHHGPHDRGEEQNARHLEREQIIPEQRFRDRRDHAFGLDLLRSEPGRQRQPQRRLCLRECEDLRENGDADRARGQLPRETARVGWTFTSAEVQEHDHE